MKLGLRQLADEPLGERPFLVADLGLGALVGLRCAVHLVSEVEPLEEKPSWCVRIAIGVVLPRQVNVPTAIGANNGPDATLTATALS